MTFLTNLWPKLSTLVNYPRSFTSTKSLSNVDNYNHIGTSPDPEGVRMTDWKSSEKKIKATIIGHEIIIQSEKYVVFKLRVEDISLWSVDNVPVWHIYRRYSDFLHLFHKLKKSFPLLKVDFPPRRWLGNNFDHNFLGRRMAKLQNFVRFLLDDAELFDEPLVRRFFCLDTPPNRNVAVEFDRSIFDSFEQLVQELREQLRTREILELTSHNQKEAIREREVELETLRAEMDVLRKQKEGLMKALGRYYCMQDDDGK